MIEIPNLDQLSLDAQEKHYKPPSVITDPSPDNSQPSTSDRQIYQSQPPADTHLHDSKASSFKELHAQLGTPINLQDGPIGVFQHENSPALSHGHYYSDSQNFFENQDSSDSFPVSASYSQVVSKRPSVSFRNDSLSTEPLNDLAKQECNNSDKPSNTNHTIIETELDRVDKYYKHNVEKSAFEPQETSIALNWASHDMDANMKMGNKDVQFVSEPMVMAEPSSNEDIKSVGTPIASYPQEQIHLPITNPLIEPQTQPQPQLQPQIQPQPQVIQDIQSISDTEGNQTFTEDDLIESNNEAVETSVISSGLLGDQYSSFRRGLATDNKSPAEYTLHILFTQFVRHAERKLNLCLDYPLNEEPPVIDLLAEGVDPQFDKILASLGYIARKKPSPVIDSVMFWRKSKSEVAAMASQEVERVLQMTRNANVNLQQSNRPSSHEYDPSAPVNIGRAKRSLSLMRTKSFSKLSHRRVVSSAAVTPVQSNNAGNGSNLKYNMSNLSASDEHKALEFQMIQARETAIQADRKSLASINILCRVLLEVIRQAPQEIIGGDLGTKLEEIIYTQLKTTDPISTSESLIRSANWNLFAQLLGYMSEKRFISVSDRFIADLEKVPAQVTNQNDEPKLHLLIHGMKYLRLTNFPLEKFEEGAEFLQSLGKFFGKSKNESVIFAYCDVIGSLVLPIAGVLTAEVNHPTWVDSVEKIYQKAIKIGNMTNNSTYSSQTLSTTELHWHHSVLLISSILSVSPKDLFASNWFEFILQNMHKLKPKVSIFDRTTFIACINRLIWTYLYRLPDSLNNTIKKLDALFGNLFFHQVNKKSQWIVADPQLLNELISLFKIIGYQHLNYIIDNGLIPLIKQSFNGFSLEGANIEKLILVVKSYVAVLQGYEAGGKPAFPSGNEIYDVQLDSKDFKGLAKNSKNEASHDEICKGLVMVLKLLDEQYGVRMLIEGETNSKSTFFHFDFTDSATKTLHLNLFATLIESLPWTEEISSQLQFKNVVEILVRNSVHREFIISSAAIKSLKRLANKINCSALLTIFAKIAFQFQEKPPQSFSPEYSLTGEFKKFLKLYVELLNVWLAKFKESGKASSSTLNSDEDGGAMHRDVLNDLYQINAEPAVPPKNQRYELEWKSIITAIEEIEGNGLFFLCSYDSKTRHFGLVILRIVEQFDRAMTTEDHSSKNSIGTHSRSSSKFAADIGTRLIHLLDDIDFLELIKPIRHSLSGAERARLNKLKNKKHILSKLCESDYGIDITLWFRLFPKILDIFFERCPMPVALCRSIVCVRMVQLHEGILEFANTNKTYTSSLFGKVLGNGPPPEVLVEQWKLYLIFAACSLTSTNDQKISFPVESKGHGRKKSMQIYVQHQKITSAKSIFRMVIPLLASKQQMVQNSVIVGLSCININIFRTLLENVPPSVTDWEPNKKKRDPLEDQLRIEMIHVLSNVTGRFKNSSEIYSDEWTVTNLVAIIKSVKTFLSTPFAQNNIAFQRLRRYFAVLLENFYDGVTAIYKEKSDKYIPFEARLGCFNFLKEWCGYGEGSLETAEERYAAMLAQQKGERASAEAILEIEKKALSQASLSCMSKLCSGTIRHEIDVGTGTPLAVLSFDIPGLLSWIHGLFTSDIDSVHDYGKVALRHIIPQDSEIYSEVLKQCYMEQKSAKTTESYFTVFAEVLMTNSVFENEVPYDVLCLSMFLIGNESFAVRQSAINLLIKLEKLQSRSISNQFTECVCSRSKIVYQKALFDISAASARAVAEAALSSTATSNNEPEGLFERISCFTMFFNLVGSSARRDILSCLLPWMQIVQLKRIHDGEDAPLDAGSYMVLVNLFELTVKFSNSISNEVEALWVALGSAAGNFDEIIRFVLNLCLEKKNASFVEYSRQIVDYLSFAQIDRSYVLNKLIGNLNSRAMVPPVAKNAKDMDSGFFEEENDGIYIYTANLSQMISNQDKDVAFSIGQLSLVFLVDLLPYEVQRMKEALPLLLHVSFSLLDHYLQIVQEQAGMLLIHLIHTIAPNATKAQETIELLRQRDHIKHLWVYDDLNEKRGMSGGARTPKSMDLLVRNVLEIFSEKEQEKSLQETWSRVALNWATTCAVRHLACRSFQIFRLLLVELDQGMLKDMLHRLSNTISDAAMEIQGFAMQILMTLNALTAELDSKKLIDFPQLFWSSVACLSTIHEQEYIEALSTMSKFVSKIDLDAPDTISCLVSTFPPKWEGKFEGLQQVVLVGLRSGTAWDAALKFLDKISKLKDSEVIGSGDLRLLMAILANLPRFLHALEIKKVEEIAEPAQVLSEMADQNPKYAPISRILVSLSKNRFRSKKDFLNQTLINIKNLFFPTYEAQALVFLLGLCPNKIPWVKLETMSILKEIFPLIDFQRDEFIGVGADLISPLLRLLLTDYAENALRVLDEAVLIPGSQLDKDVLRMSLGNTSIKKEYEKTATLFGVPDDSGWSVPMPAITAASTRNNIHAVFATCATAAELPKVEEETEEIQFHMEDYYAPPEVHDMESVNVGEPDASLSNMWAALDDFDSFFTNHPPDAPVEQYGHTHSASVDTNETLEDLVVDSAPSVYDKKVSAILNRSLARTQSNMSFKSSFGDQMAGSQGNLGVPVGSPSTIGSQKRSYIPFSRYSKASGALSNLSKPGDGTNAANNGKPSSSTGSGSLTPVGSGFIHGATSPKHQMYESDSLNGGGGGSDSAGGAEIGSGSGSGASGAGGASGPASPRSPPPGTVGSGGVLGLIDSPFESLLGSNKKRPKKTSRFSPETQAPSSPTDWTSGTPKSPSGLPKVRKERKKVSK